jgi:hypothetical protein
MTGPDGKAPAPTSGYANFRYDVRVLRWFAGTGKTRLVLKQGTEADSAPLAPGRLLVFSACASGKDQGYEPDVGYFFGVEPACRADAEALMELASRQAARKGKPAACEQR